MLDHRDMAEANLLMFRRCKDRIRNDWNNRRSHLYTMRDLLRQARRFRDQAAQHDWKHEQDIHEKLRPVWSMDI